MQNPIFSVIPGRRVLVPWIVLTAWIMFVLPSIASEVMRASGDSWHPAGIFCCKVFVNEATEIRAFRLSGAKPEALFTKRMAKPVRTPICLSNAVVAVSTEGVINKFNLQGELLFSTKLDGFEGSAMSSVRLGNRHIFITEVRASGERKAKFLIHVVDVSGEKPVWRSSYEIIPPNRYATLRNELVIIGEEDVQRLKLPEEYMD